MPELLAPSVVNEPESRPAIARDNFEDLPHFRIALTGVGSLCRNAKGLNQTPSRLAGAWGLG